MYKYKKHVLVSLIILLSGVNFALLAQDLEIRFTDKPIPGVPLNKGGVAKIQKDSADLSKIPLDAGMIKSAASDVTATQQPDDSMPIHKGLSKKSVVTIDPLSMLAGSATRAAVIDDSLIDPGEAIRGESSKISKQTSDVPVPGLIGKADKDKGSGKDEPQPSNTADPNLIANYTPSGWDYPIVPSSVSGTNTTGPSLEGGTTTYIDFAFVNRDAEIPSSTRFYIYFYSDGSALAGFYWDGIGADYYGYVEDYEHTFSAGDHTLRTNVDATDVVAESNESDNTYQRQFTWGGGTTEPNLVANYTPSGWDYPIVPSSVSGTNTVGPNLQGGSTTYVDFAFVNRDAEIPSSTRFYIYFYSDGSALAGFYWDGIGADYYGYVEDYEHTFSSGNHTLRTNVDATDVVDESNESDNTYQRQFSWGGTTKPNLIANYTPSGWDFPIVASSVSGTHTVGPNLEAGVTTYIDIAFINRDAEIPSSTRFYLYLSIDGSYQAGFYWDGIGEDYYGYVEDYQHTFSSGDHTLRSRIDATGVVDESNEGDNVYDKQYSWTGGTTDPNLIADYTPSGWDYPIVASSVSGTHTVGPDLQGGTTSYIDIAFVNRNAEIPSSTRFYLYLSIDGSYQAGFYWDGMGQDYYGYVEDYEHTFSGGDHTLRSRVDATGVVDESNENDNVYDRTYSWGGTTPKPNLIADYTPSGWDYPIVPSSVSGTNTVGPDLQGGSTTYLDFAFINRDADIETSTRFYVYLYSDGSALSGFYWDGIPQNYYGYVEDYEHTFSDGNHTLMTEADATDVVDESNESDNAYSRQFSWGGAPPPGPNLIADYTPSGWDYPIVPSSVSGTNSVGPNLQGGTTTYVDFAFVNRDEAIPSSTRIYTYFYVDGSATAGFYWDGIGVDYYGYVEDYEYTFTNGDHILKTFADATDVVSESNESDNEYQRQFTWGIGEPDIEVNPLALDIYEGAGSPNPVDDNQNNLPPGGEHAMGHIIPEAVKAHWKTHSPDVRYKQEALLASIDWSSDDSPVKNQGNCGSCWAFSAVGLTENLSGTSDLSEQTVVSCTPDGDCGGGWHGDALHYIHNDGAPNESCYPYIASNGNCADKCANPSMLVKVNQYDHYGRWGEATSATVNNLKALLQNGPVLVHMEVPADNSFNGNPGYTGGIYDYNGGPIPSGRGHSVLAVGYNDDQQYFKVKNSWGAGWGENGYFRISYDDVTDYVRFGGYACTASGTSVDGGESDFTIYNVGSGELHVSEIASNKGWLSVDPAVPPTLNLAGNESQSMKCNVNWNSVPGQTDEAQLTIYSDDGDEPTVIVTVTAHKEYNPPPIPNAPTLSSPPNNATNQQTSLTLRWNASSGAASYELQVDDNQNFSSPVVNRSGITSTSQVVSGLAEGTLYYWRVNASNSSGTSPWSGVWRFTTQADVPEVPTLVSPPNNAVNQPTSLTLEWNTSAGAASYQLQVDNDSNFGSPAFNQSGLTETSQDVTGLATSTLYHWRVRAANSAGTSSWSSVWSFTTFSSDETVVATVGCEDIAEGGQVSIPINVDMSGVNSPNNNLGSYTATLEWNPAQLSFTSFSGGNTTGWGSPTVNTSETSSGHLDFASANPSGTTGEINILNVTFDVTGTEGQSGSIDLEFSALTAASTFMNLLPYLTTEDCDYTIMPSGILGDINGDENVNSTDALIVLSCDVGIDVSQFCPMNCGDVNGDGLVNSTDALIILSYDVGIDVPFPVGETGCPSNVTPCPGCNP
ncbi:hypothetical protein GF337_19885 [candidate division KSB1 bacterium]|nr:hypothetical protein [candidate division KSB1 bacterium]